MRNLSPAAACAVAGALATAAAAQTSHDMTLLSHQNLYPSYAACWGWTSPGGQELALLGASTGTSIVDVTVPTAPIERAFVPGVNSVWREMKAYDHYAYIVTEGSGGGMQIVDLATSPPSLVTTYSATFNTAHTITIVGGYAYVSGARLNGTPVGIRILSLANPTSPVDVGGWNGYYAHDCQVRGNTLWAACINNDLVAVVDISNKAAPVLLKTFTWTGNNAHNCDLTVDGRYLLTTDEVAGGHLHVWDVSDLDNIRLVAEWTANPAGIIHNVHVRGNLAYCSYYTEGVRVLDIGNPEYPVEVGYYDTWPGVSGGFNGCWEVYPYAASGNAYLSDISTGLYVVRYSPSTGSASGTVRESGGGPVLAGATVARVGGPSAVTNAAGYYKLFDAPGTRTLVTTLFGYEPDSAVVSIGLGADTPHDVQLVPLPGTPVQGTVRDAGTSAPLAGTSLVLGGTPRVESSGAGGTYAFGRIPYGVYVLTASRFGYVPESRTVTVSVRPPQQPVTADFDLAPAALAADFESGPMGFARVAPPNEATSGLWVWGDPVGRERRRAARGRSLRRARRVLLGDRELRQPG